jgi:prepilin-type N-terminal cleavage/methylation domain-containing protein
MKFEVSSCGRRLANAPRHPPLACHRGKNSRAYTLIELMIVVAIIGLIAAMGVPALNRMLIKEGMRKAVSDITETCITARAEAIFSGHTVAVVIRPGPADRSFAIEGGGNSHGSPYASASSGRLPDGVDIEAFGINTLDYTESEFGRILFYSDGTSDEMALVLRSRGDERKITLEYATGYPLVTDLK